MSNQKTDKLMNLTKNCWKNLECAEALTNLLQDKFMEDKNTIIALNMLFYNIQDTQKTILDIQDEIV